MKRTTLVTLIAVLAFGSTLTSQNVECTVTVAFRSSSNVGTASAASEADALREAQTAACGPLSQGMDDRIACSRVPPVEKSCRGL
jgi:hypothetical protein